MQGNSQAKTKGDCWPCYRKVVLALKRRGWKAVKWPFQLVDVGTAFPECWKSQREPDGHTYTHKVDQSEIDWPGTWTVYAGNGRFIGTVTVDL